MLYSTYIALMHTHASPSWSEEGRFFAALLLGPIGQNWGAVGCFRLRCIGSPGMASERAEFQSNYKPSYVCSPVDSGWRTLSLQVNRVAVARRVSEATSLRRSLPYHDREQRTTSITDLTCTNCKAVLS
jgi:hypothetical protein